MKSPAIHWYHVLALLAILSVAALAVCSCLGCRGLYVDVPSPPSDALPAGWVPLTDWQSQQSQGGVNYPGAPGGRGFPLGVWVDPILDGNGENYQ